MTDKQRRFCEEYLIDCNATQAAIRAGYSERTANRIASENLSKPDIQQYISVMQEEARGRVSVTRDDVIRQLERIGLSDIDPEDVRIADKLKALDMLIKMLGYDKPDEQMASGGGVIVLPGVIEDG